MSHSITNQSRSGRSLELTPRTVHYFHSLALNNRRASASELAQGLSVEI